VFTVAAGSGEVVVMVSAGFTGSVKGPVLTPPTLSVTLTLKVTGPDVGGIPVRTPAALRVSQPGRPDADHA
jgi:hypothetical protein